MSNINKNNILGEYQPYDVKTYTSDNDNVDNPLIFVEYSDNRKQPLFRKTNLSYNPSTNTLNVVNLNVSGTGGGDTTSIDITDTDTDGTYYITFASDTGTEQTLRADKTTTALTYNPNTSTITATQFNGNASTSTQTNVIDDTSTNSNLNICFANSTGNTSIRTCSDGVLMINPNTGITSIDLLKCPDIQDVGVISGNSKNISFTNGTINNGFFGSDTSTNTNFSIFFGDTAQSDFGFKYDNSNLFYNPSTGILNATNLSGNILTIDATLNNSDFRLTSISNTPSTYNQMLYTDITYNPQTNILKVGKLDNCFALTSSGSNLPILFIDQTATGKQFLHNSSLFYINPTLGEFLLQGNITTQNVSCNNITMTSTDTGSSANPELILYRNSSSPASGDYLGQIQFKGKNSNGGDEIYAKITGKIRDETLGTEDGLIETAIKGNGSFVIVSRQRDDELQLLNGCGLSVDGKIEGLNDCVIEGDVGIKTATPSVSLDVNDTDAIKMPVGTTAQRPTGANGMIRFNSDDGDYEAYKAGAWSAIGGSGIMKYTQTDTITTYSINASPTDISALTVSITPKSTSSVIKIQVSIFGEFNAEEMQDVNLYLKRTIGATSVYLKSSQSTSGRQGISMMSRTFYSSNVSTTPEVGFFNYFDTPNTTSSVSYVLVMDTLHNLSFKLNSTTNESLVYSENGISSITATDGAGTGGGESIWLSTGSNIYYTAGDVGIRRTNPSHPLDVSGIINYSDRLIGGETNGANNNHIDCYYNGNSSLTRGIFLGYYGNIGAGYSVYVNANPTAPRSLGIVVTGASYFSGFITKAGGGFTIKHPVLGDDYRLIHSFVEAPEASNIYRGKAQLINGTIDVNIDKENNMTEGTFIALNTNFNIYVNNNDENSWDMVKGKLNGNILTIYSNNPECNAVIDYLVIGERQDEFMKSEKNDATDCCGKIIVERPSTKREINRNLDKDDNSSEFWKDYYNKDNCECLDPYKCYDLH